MTTFAAVQAHFLNTGAAVTGVAPNGVDSVETKLRGRYRKWTGCTDGGLFGFEHAATVHGSPSGALKHILWNLPGVTAVTLTWVDMDGLEVVWNANAGTPGLVDMQQLMVVTPQGHNKVSVTGVLTSPGAIVTIWEKGFEDDVFAHLKTLGAMPLP